MKATIKMTNFEKTWFFTFLAVISFLPQTLRAQTDSNKPNDARRAAAVETMRAMAVLEWSSKKDLTYWNSEYGKVFQAGKTYRGIPYTQRQRNTDVKTFLAETQTRDGRRIYLGPDDYLGSDCSSAVSLAWRTADPDFPILSTYDMLPDRHNGITKVGAYKSGGQNSTGEIITENGAETMYKAYDRLSPGDALLTRKNENGHIMLVVSVDPKEQIVRIIDQSGVDGEGKLRKNNSTWRVDYPFSYEDLLQKAFIPVALIRLNTTAEEER